MKKRVKNKRGKKKAMTQLKSYFLIVNIVIAVVSFSVILNESVSALTPEEIAKQDAEILKKATIDRWGTDEETVFSTLESYNRDPTKINLIKQEYQKLTGNNLIGDLKGELSFGDEDRVLAALQPKETINSGVVENVAGESSSVEGVIGGLDASTPESPSISPTSESLTESGSIGSTNPNNLDVGEITKSTTDTSTANEVVTKYLGERGVDLGTPITTKIGFDENVYAQFSGESNLYYKGSDGTWIKSSFSSKKITDKSLFPKDSDGSTTPTPTTGGEGSSTLSKVFNTGVGTGWDAIATGAQWAFLTYGIIKLGSGMFGVSKTTGDALAAAGAVGLGAYKFLTTLTAKSSVYSGIAELPLGKHILTHPGLWSIGAAIVVFALMYKKTSTEIVEFNCQPWEAPIGGKDCELCNEIQGGCSEYRCKSLGQACDLVNKGTEDEKCVWVNPHDVNSPMIRILEVLKGYKWVPDKAVRPPATGVVISENDGSCVEAFTPLEFTIETDEPSQCKIDYNLTRGFEEMSYYFGGSNLFAYNHTEEMSLPGPDAINAIAPELKNDGTYTLYVRCQDANGNFNQDAFSVRFCVEPGPDATAPRIVDINIPSKSPVQYNTTSLDIEVYVNEPSECKWSREDRTFDNMENSMSCSTNLWEMNNQNVYTCLTTLTGIKDRENNDFYFRCKDQPNAQEGDRNVNTQSYKYTIIGTQPLNILSVGPNETIKGSTDTIPVYLTVKTDNGYKNGEAVCYYSTTDNEEDYIQFLETGTNKHEQRQDLTTGSYKYYFKCVDLGGNAAYDSTEFNVEVDRSSPTVVRVYKEGDLKIITNEKSICSYSTKDCNFEIKDGISMPYDNNEIHTAEWKVNQNYYIRCKDEYDNQPNSNTCSIVVRPYELGEDVIEL